MERDELAAWLRLTLTPGIGPVSTRGLLAAFGLPDEVFRQSDAALRQVVGEKQTLALRQEPPELPSLLETTWQWMLAPDASGGRAVVTWGDPSYPAALLAIEDPPPLLYLLGTGATRTGLAPAMREQLARSIAVVGSRNPTPQGLQHARGFARACSEAGLAVVSGLALGIDGAAHEGALEGATPAPQAALATVAVVGTGLDRVYPRRHQALAHRIARQGLLISEYPLGTPPLAQNFPRRNRLISGLARGTLVVEAALQSGSLITARMAAEQGKEVFAIPGSIDSPQARGCHALIKQGAKLVESAADIFEELRLPAPLRPASAGEQEQALVANDSSEGGDELLQALGHGPAGFDTLVARTGLATSELQGRLLTLELDGRIGRLPGGFFQRIAPA